jgi:hypothetical protein
LSSLWQVENFITKAPRHHNQTGIKNHSLHPMNLVFAADRSSEAVRDTLFDNRSVAFFGDEMAGPEAMLQKLSGASVTV